MMDPVSDDIMDRDYNRMRCKDALREVVREENLVSIRRGAKMATLNHVPGFKLRKPLEVLAYKSGGWMSLNAVWGVGHALPTSDGRGYLVDGYGGNLQEAARNFSGLLSGIYSDLEDHASLEMTSDVGLQWQYLNSIMVREESGRSEGGRE